MLSLLVLSWAGFLLLHEIASRLEGWGRYRRFLFPIDKSIFFFLGCVSIPPFFVFTLPSGPDWGVFFSIGTSVAILSVYLDLRTKFLFKILSWIIFCVLIIFSVMNEGINYYLLILTVLMMIFSFLNPIKGLGGGDIPFFISFLPIIDPKLISVYLLISSLISLSFLLVLKKRKTPLGPSIFIGAGITFLISYSIV